MTAIRALGGLLAVLACLWALPAFAQGSELIRLNQRGYFPEGPKRANFVSVVQKPLDWELVAANGETVLSGKARAQGFDPSSGLETLLIDFSRFSGTGVGFTLRIGGERSYPFAIEENIYDSLSVDAFSYFYLVRSGIGIEEAIAEKGYGRPAGHLGVPPNAGDVSVGCVERATARRIYGEAWSCDYRLDVSGGWYDAGDFGKYVVNGGIAVAQMMGAYERALNHVENSQALDDGWLRIPEGENGVPDLLDEARWELDFLISMMVPEGEPLAGMAHHKVHGNRWTVGPIMPHRDPAKRVLHRPSTAATLNLAAAAAQGARLFTPFDPAYAEKLLETAMSAYRAAEAHPELYAPLTDGSFGGGDYSDDDVSDEFYWAAVELFLTTGETEWLERAKASSHWEGPVFWPGGFNWRSVAGLARIRLARVPSRLPEGDLEAVQLSVRAAANIYLATQSTEAFGFMYRPDQGFGWGSNHSLLENMIVVAAAYDISGKPAYLEGIRESMDYLLGRNALGLSYITGHGSHFAHRQFSNMFAHALDPAFPPPPQGALAGGPNSQPADEVAIRELQDCAPQACYVDDPRSFSTNEIAINWNAPLGFIASFLADTR